MVSQKGLKPKGSAGRLCNTPSAKFCATSPNRSPDFYQTRVAARIMVARVRRHWATGHRNKMSFFLLLKLNKSSGTNNA